MDDKTPLYISVILQSIVNFLTDKDNSINIKDLINLSVGVKDNSLTVTKAGKNISVNDKTRELINAGVILAGIKSHSVDTRIQSMNKFVSFAERKAKEICKGGNHAFIPEMVRRSALFLNVNDNVVSENRKLMEYMVDNECLPLSTDTFISLFSASLMRLYTKSCKNAISNMTKLDSLTREISRRPNTVEELNRLIDLKKNIQSIVLYEVYPSVLLSYYKKRDQRTFMYLQSQLNSREAVLSLLASRDKVIGGTSEILDGISQVNQIANLPEVKQAIQTASNFISKPEVKQAVNSVVKVAQKVTGKKEVKSKPIPLQNIDAKMFALYNLIDGLLIVLNNFSCKEKPKS
jgi:hypothetical protein